MIYWFTGQPGAGKTTLANALEEYLVENNLAKGQIFKIDGDDLRELTSNKDYSIKGRVDNVTTAQKLAKYLDNKGNTVIVSVVAPYIDQREDFKTFAKGKVVEIYVKCDKERGREEYFAKAYMKPEDSFIEIDTTDSSIDESLNELVLKLYPPAEEAYVEEPVKKQTYFVDIDGTVFKYRKFGTYETEKAQVINSTFEHLRELEANGDMIILTTARPENLYEHTLKELNENGIPFNKLIMGIERGSRVVVNDRDPAKGEDRAIAINVDRDKGI